MDFINHERQDIADALEVCVRNCANNPEFVAEFNRITGCSLPNNDEGEIKQFVAFVGEFVLLPMMPQFLEPTP